MMSPDSRPDFEAGVADATAVTRTPDFTPSVRPRPSSIVASCAPQTDRAPSLSRKPTTGMPAGRIPGGARSIMTC
jgi:hypothetical protein